MCFCFVCLVVCLCVLCVGRDVLLCVLFCARLRLCLIRLCLLFLAVCVMWLFAVVFPFGVYMDIAFGCVVCVFWHVFVCLLLIRV